MLQFQTRTATVYTSLTSPILTRELSPSTLTLLGYRRVHKISTSVHTLLRSDLWHCNCGVAVASVVVIYDRDPDTPDAGGGGYAGMPRTNSMRSTAFRVLVLATYPQDASLAT